MSWVDRELSVEWPSSDTNRTFNTTGKGSGFHSRNNNVTPEPTVAIRTGSNSKPPQWKQAIQQPRPKSTNSHRVTHLFVDPVVKNTVESETTEGTELRKSKSAPLNSNKGNDVDFALDSSSMSTSSTQSEAPKRPIGRRLKVVGRPDTYTNERLGNLLSSMGGANLNNEETTPKTLDQTSATELHSRARSEDSNSHSDTIVSMSDADLAHNLQNEGRRVLQDLAPFRPNLSAVQESSLDELEQQLTSQGLSHPLNKLPKTNDTRIGAETTSSPLSGSSSSAPTLESLVPGTSNWETQRHTGTGKQNNVLKKESSHSLLRSRMSNDKAKVAENSNPTSRRKPLSHYQDPVSEVSALDINKSLRYKINPGNAFDISHVANSTGIPAATMAGGSLSELSASTSSTKQYHHSSVSEQNPLSPVHESSKVQSTPRIRLSSLQAFDRTPDDIVRKNLRFSARRTPTGTIRRNADDTDVANDFETSSSRIVENSIAAKDVSFSAGYELLAQLIRERTSHLPVSSSLESLDVLDLSDAGLESVTGIENFVPNVTTLFLSDNKIRTLQGLPFNVVHLDLSSNLLSNMNSFPVSFVSTLVLNNNQLETLEPLQKLRALSSLDVSNNKLQSLKGIDKLTALRSLNIRRNNLESLDLNLSMLVELDAAHNNISAVRLNTPNLESLDLEGNQVLALTSPLPNLRELNLRYNDTVIDFSGWQSLETLLIDGQNAFRNLDAISGNLVTFSWQKPYSKSQQTYKIPNRLLGNIRDLNLAGRSSGWPFKHDGLVYSAQHLDISLCDIHELPDNFHETFPFLKSLNLAFNKLDSRCIPTLAKCRRLERLSLFANKLELNGEQLARKLPQLRFLDTRSQSPSRLLLEPGEYCTESYKALIEEDNAAEGPISRTISDRLQWLDGRWTNHAANTTQITRPGFRSPLYPDNWSPPVVGESLKTTDGEASLMDYLTASDILEAALVHHYCQKFGYGSGP